MEVGILLYIKLVEMEDQYVKTKLPITADLYTYKLQDMAVYFILEGSIDVNTQDFAGWTALHEACTKGCFNIAKLLVQHGAKVNISSHDGTR